MSRHTGVALRMLPIVMLAMTIGIAAPATAGDDLNAVNDDASSALNTSPRRPQPEPTIALNPMFPAIIAGGAQDFRKTTEINGFCGGNRWNGLYLTLDGGATWENSLAPGYCTDPTQGFGTELAVSEMFGLSTNTDPVIVFDDFGNMYYSHIAFNDNKFVTTPPSDVGVLLVSTYRYGGLTHAKTVKVPSGSGMRQAKFLAGPGASNFDDKQWMAVDNSAASPYYGRVYVTWTKFGAQGGQSSIWLSSCGGGGLGFEECDSFTDAVVVNKPVAGGLVQESFPATAPDGTLYVGFLQFQGGFGSTLPHSGIWIAKSTDGGVNFQQQKVADIQQIPSPIPPVGTAANDGFNSFRTGTAVGTAVTADGTVHLVWGEWIGGAHAEIKYSRSTDGGATWSAPIAMNDVATGHQLFPNIAADGNDLHVAWLDGRLNPAGQTITKLQVFYNKSTTAGATFEPDVKISDAPFNPNTVSRFPVFCQAFIGDYIDIDAVDGKVAIIWSDNRNVVNPLTPAECADFRTRPTDPAIQARLNGGALDQDAYVQVILPPSQSAQLPKKKK